MTYIQIITLHGDKYSYRCLIDEYSKSKYKMMISVKSQNEDYYSDLKYLDDTFVSARQALESATLIATTNENNLVKVGNEVSCLLSTEEIKEITNVNSLFEY